MSNDKEEKNPQSEDGATYLKNEQYLKHVEALRDNMDAYRQGPPGTPPGKHPGDIFDKIPFSTTGDLFGGIEERLGNVHNSLLPQEWREKLIGEGGRIRSEVDKDLEIVKMLRYNRFYNQLTEYAYNKQHHPERAKVEDTMFSKLENGQELLDELVETVNIDYEKKSGMFFGENILAQNEIQLITDVLSHQEAVHVGALNKIERDAVEDAKEKGNWPIKEYTFRSEHFKGDRRETPKFSKRVLETLDVCGDLSEEDKKFGVDMFKKNFGKADFDEIFIDGKSVNELCHEKTINPTDEEKMCMVSACALDKEHRLDFRVFDNSTSDKRCSPISVTPEMAPETKKYNGLLCVLRIIINLFNPEKRAEALADFRSSRGQDPEPEFAEIYREDKKSGKREARHKGISERYYQDRRTEDERERDELSDIVSKGISAGEKDYKSKKDLADEHLDNIKAGAFMLDKMLESKTDKRSVIDKKSELDEADFQKAKDTEIKSKSVGIKTKNIFKNVKNIMSKEKNTVPEVKYKLGDEDCKNLTYMSRLYMLDSDTDPYGPDEKKKQEVMSKLANSVGKLISMSEQSHGDIKDGDLTSNKRLALKEDIGKLMKNSASLKMPDVDLTDPADIAKNYDELKRLADYGNALDRLYFVMPDSLFQEFSLDERKQFKKTCDNLKTLSVLNPASQVENLEGLCLGAEGTNISAEVRDHRDDVDKIYLSKKLCEQVGKAFKGGAKICDIETIDPGKAQDLSDSIEEDIAKERSDPDSAKQRAKMLEDDMLGIARKDPENAKKQEQWKLDCEKTEKALQIEKEAEEREKQIVEEKQRKAEENRQKMENEKAEWLRKVDAKRQKWLKENKGVSDSVTSAITKGKGSNDIEPVTESQVKEDAGFKEANQPLKPTGNNNAPTTVKNKTMGFK